MLAVDDKAFFQRCEHEEETEPSPRKELGDRTIYLSSKIRRTTSVDPIVSDIAPLGLAM